MKVFNFLDIFHWYLSHYSAYGRKNLMKVDAAVVLFLGPAFYPKYLDQLNIFNVYVSGMREDLRLFSDKLNLFSMSYNIAYAIFQLPIILLIQKQALSRYLIILCQLLWGICTSASELSAAALCFNIHHWVCSGNIFSRKLVIIHLVYKRRICEKVWLN